MRHTALFIALLLATLAGRGACATESAPPADGGSPSQCKDIPSEPDKALIADQNGAPLDGFDPSRVCAASSQSPLAKATGATNNYCVDIYLKLGDAAKKLKAELAAAGAKSKNFKLDCNESPDKCRNFYDQNAEQVKDAVKQEASFQPRLQEYAKYFGDVKTEAGDQGTAYKAYTEYGKKLATELNKSPNVQQALALADLNGTKASMLGTGNLGDAWKKLAGAPYNTKELVKPRGPLFAELGRAHAVAERAQLFAACKLVDSKRKVASLGGNIKKLAVNSRNSGPAAQMAAGKGAGDKSTITGDTTKGASGPTASQGGGGGGGDPMGAASKMMQQAAQLAQQMNQKGGGQGGSAASAANPALASAASTSATPSSTASSQPTSYSFANAGGASAPSSSTGGSTAATSSSSSQPTGDGVVAFDTGAPAASGGAAPAFASRGARSGASGQGGSPASASASGGGSANVSSGAVGGPSMAGADPQKAADSNDTGASVAGGGGLPGFSGGGSSGGGGFGGAAADAGSLKALDAQFNAASANMAGKFDLAPLPALPPLDGNLAAAPATSATPQSLGASATGLAEQIPGLDAAVAEAAAGNAAPASAANGPAPASAQNQAGAAARLPAHFLPGVQSPAFLGSENVSLFQRIHSTSERAIRRIKQPVAAAL